jgi:hypothetical protein
MQDLGEGTIAIRVLGAGSPMTLSLRPVPDPGTRADPLRGREIWHTVTDTTVLAGPRSPAGAVRLLDQVRCPTLTRMRQRLIAATHDAPGEPSATAAALGTLLQWPCRARTALVHDVACAVDAAFQSSLLTDHPEVSRTLGWVLALTLAHPGDPLVLAPILLRVRRLPAGSSFVLPAGWPFARLTGAAVGVGTGEHGLLRATLGGDHGDVAPFVCALERQPSRTVQPAALPARGRTARGRTARGRTSQGRTSQQRDDAVERALDLARQMSALHPQLATSPDVIDLRDRPSPRTGGHSPRTGGQPRLLHHGARRGIG